MVLNLCPRNLLLCHQGEAYKKPNHPLGLSEASRRHRMWCDLLQLCSTDIRKERVRQKCILSFIHQLIGVHMLLSSWAGNQIPKLPRLCPHRVYISYGGRKTTNK